MDVAGSTPDARSNRTLEREKYVRGRWPEVLISWTHLLQGGWRDALVGRDVLFGILFGIAMHLMMRLEYLAPTLLGVPLPPAARMGFANLAPTRIFVAAIFHAQYVAVVDALGILFLLLLFRVSCGARRSGSPSRLWCFRS